MLLRLPLEIFLNVSNHLNFKDKLSLKTTCVKLNEHITRVILYEKLSLILDDSSSNKLQKLIDNKFDGSAVKELRVDLYASSDHIINQLSDVFPNVKRITTDIVGLPVYNDYQSYQPEYYYTTVPFIKWRNTIENIDLRKDWHELIIDLMHHEYPRLTELHINNASFVFETLSRYQKISFFNNAPLLTSLKLFDVEISLEILEAIHNGCPLLKSLSMIGTTIDLERASTLPPSMSLAMIDNTINLEKTMTLPPSITPANTVNYLELCYSCDFNTNDVVLMYMLKKYPKLQQLVYNIDPGEEYSMITHFYIGHHDFPDADAVHSNSEYDDSISYNKQIFQSYSAQEAQFFLNLPKSIKTLSSRTIKAEAAIAALVESGVNMTTLDLLAIYVDSLAARTIPKRPMFVEAAILQDIKKFTALRTLKIPINLPSQIFTPDFISPNVTKLYISLYAPITFLESILSVFPSLEELYVVRDCVSSPPNHEIRGRDDDTEEIQPRKTYPKLRTIHIKFGRTHPEFFLFVKTALPNLNDLKVIIDLSEFEHSKIYKVDLSDYSLNYCHLSFYYYNVDYTVTMQNISRRVLAGRSSKYSVLNHRKYISTQDLHYLEIIVDRINNFKVDGSSIVNMGGKILIDGKT